MIDFNSKTSPNQMRDLMNLMRNVGSNTNISFNNTNKKELMNENNFIRKTIKNIRKLNENTDVVNRATDKDFEFEIEKAKSYFPDSGLRFTDENNKPLFEITDDYVFLGGVINGVIRFAFTVTKDAETSKVVFDYTEDFSPENPENEEIIEKIEQYYESFKTRWLKELNK